MGNWARGALMAEAVKALPNEVQDNIELQIWNVKKIEGLNRQKALNVVRIPTMTINKRLAFESLIPDQEELLDVTREFLLEFNEGE